VLDHPFKNGEISVYYFYPSMNRLEILNEKATSSENCQYKPSHNDEEFNIDEFETDEEAISIIPEIEDVLIEKELSWDDLVEFDEIISQENTSSHYIDEVETTGKLNRFQRARQIATEVIQAYDWDMKNISLLEQVFIENGWGMARVSIERELSEGLIPEELELALFIRQLWTDNQQYWISFIHITSNQPGQEARAAYKNISWTESLRIIRSFNKVPSEEELQFFIYQLYDDWYSNTTLQRQYKAFFKYLKYRTGLGRCSLARDEIFFLF